MTYMDTSGAGQFPDNEAAKDRLYGEPNPEQNPTREERMEEHKARVDQAQAEQEGNPLNDETDAIGAGNPSPWQPSRPGDEADDEDVDPDDGDDDEQDA